MSWLQINEEVYYSQEEIPLIDKEMIVNLLDLAHQNENRKVRLCLHKKTTDNSHEMVIVHLKDCYVRPHKHIHKTESIHVLAGEAQILFFSEEGLVTQQFEMGDITSGKPFFYRLDASIYHSLIVTSDYLVFKETTEGPFILENTIFPDWAPQAKGCDIQIQNFISKFD